MAEDFKVKLGIQLDTSEADKKINALKTDIKNTGNTNPIKISLDSSKVSSQLNALKQQLKQTGNGAGNDFANGFNNGIKIMSNNSTRAIGNMKKVLKDMKFDNKSIGVVTQDLRKMDLEISKITTKMKGNNLQMSIKGIDNLGRAVTIVKEFDAKSNKIGTSGKTISQTFKTSADEIKKKSQEVNESFNRLVKMQNEIGSLKLKLVGLDKGKQEAKELNIALEEVKANYNSLFSNIGANLTSKQIIRLNDIQNKNIRDLNIKKGKNIDNQSQTKVQSTVQTTEIKNQVQEVTDAYNQLKDLQGRINSLRINIAKIDGIGKNNKLSEMSSQLDRLMEDYNNLYQISSKSFSTAQIDKLENGFTKVSDKIAVMKAEMKDISVIKSQTTAYNELLNIASQMDKASVSLTNLKGFGEHTNEIKVLETELERLRTVYQELYTSAQGSLSAEQLSKLGTTAYDTEQKITQLNAKLADLQTKKINNIVGKFDSSYTKDLDKITAGLDKIKNKSTEVKKAMDLFKTATSNMNSVKQSGDVDKITASYKQYQVALENVTKAIKQNQTAEKNAVGVEKLNQQKQLLSSQMDLWLKNNSAAASQFGSKIEELKAKLQSCNSSADFGKIKTAFQQIKVDAELAGRATQSFGDRLKSQLSIFTSYFSGIMMISRAISAVKDMFNNVHQIDTAMTELKRVTDLSSNKYDNLYDTMTKSAKEYGATVSEIVDSTASWVRLGFNPDDATKISEITTMYQHVTDLDTETAVNNLVTAYKGFEKQLLEINDGDSAKAIEHISDVYDILGRHNLPLTNYIG